MADVWRTSHTPHTLPQCM